MGEAVSPKCFLLLGTALEDGLTRGLLPTQRGQCFGKNKPRDAKDFPSPSWIMNTGWWEDLESHEPRHPESALSHS